MNIAYHSTDKFAPVMGVSIASLLENNQTSESINIYIIEHNISEANKDKLMKLVTRYGRLVHFISMPDINQVERLGLRKVREKWLFDSYCRMFLDNLLPQNLDRILFLDSDTLVTGSLDKLWNYDLQGKCVGAVMEAFSKQYYSLLGLENSKNAAICNSGVILIDLNLWRKKQIDKGVRECVKNHNGYVFFMEQGVLNIVLQGEFMFLPPRYNVRSEMQFFTYRQIQILRKPIKWYTQDEINKGIENPAIIHTTSFWPISNRVWYTKTNHPSRELYIKYKKLTEWQDEPDFPDERNIIRKIIQFIIDHTPRNLLLHVMSFVYNHLRIYKIKWDMKRIKSC